MMKNYDLKRPIHISGILTILWSVVWMFLGIFLSDAKLNSINRIHPWMIWVSVALISVIIHLILSKWKSEVSIKQLKISKLRNQAQIMMVVLVLSILWSDVLAREFPWLIEMSGFTAFELLYIQFEKSKGISSKNDLALTSILAVFCFAFSFSLKIFIEPIGNAILFVGLKLKYLIGLVFTTVSKAIVYLVRLLPKAKPMEAEQVLEIDSSTSNGMEQIASQAGSYQIMKIIFLGFLFILMAIVLIALIYVLVEKLKLLFENKRTKTNEFTTRKKDNPFKEALQKLKKGIQKIKALAILYNHKDSVGYNLYQIEKKYRRKNKLRRKSSETPDSFLNRIILYEEANNGDAALINRLKMVRNKATLCAYSKNHNWLERIE